MTVNNRDKVATLSYKTASREIKKEIVRFASCDTGATIGLLHYYNTCNFNDLKRIRKTTVKTRGERVKRKADFYFVLAQMANRLDRIKELELGLD